MRAGEGAGHRALGLLDRDGQRRSSLGLTGGEGAEAWKSRLRDGTQGRPRPTPASWAEPAKRFPERLGGASESTSEDERAEREWDLKQKPDQEGGLEGDEQREAALVEKALEVLLEREAERGEDGEERAGRWLQALAPRSGNRETDEGRERDGEAESQERGGDAEVAVGALLLGRIGSGDPVGEPVRGKRARSHERDGEEPGEAESLHRRDDASSPRGRAQESPASARGRRPQAKLVSYQSLSGWSVVPKREEWTSQPPPR